MSIDLSALSAPFPGDQIHWRPQNLAKSGDKALALAYLDARDVMDRLDAICGPENWQDRYEFHGSRTVCYLSIRLGDEWITKADGAGDSDMEAEKGAISDSLKRAAVKWGIGRYLYDLGNTWVGCESYETTKNGKTVNVWKRWTEEPWSKVRGSSRFLPAAANTQQREPLKVITNEQPSGTYKTAAGYQRQPGERLEPEDATVIGDTLIQAMEMSKTVDDLDAWAKKQRTQIATLPDAHYDTFKNSFLDYRALLVAERLAV